MPYTIETEIKVQHFLIIYP